MMNPASFMTRTQRITTPFRLKDGADHLIVILSDVEMGFGTQDYNRQDVTREGNQMSHLFWSTLQGGDWKERLCKQSLDLMEVLEFRALPTGCPANPS
jgi:hypothetical protein